VGAAANSSKPCVLVNVGGFFDGLLRFLDHTVAEGFIVPENRGLVRVARNPEEAARAG